MKISKEKRKENHNIWKKKKNRVISCDNFNIYSYFMIILFSFFFFSNIYSKSRRFQNFSCTLLILFCLSLKNKHFLVTRTFFTSAEAAGPGGRANSSLTSSFQTPWTTRVGRIWATATSADLFRSVTGDRRSSLVNNVNIRMTTFSRTTHQNNTSFAKKSSQS